MDEAPRTRAARAAAEAALVRVVHHYGERPEFAVLGGLVPELLCSGSPYSHAGTTDVDVQVDLEIAAGAVHTARLERALRNAESNLTLSAPGDGWLMMLAPMWWFGSSFLLTLRTSRRGSPSFSLSVRIWERPTFEGRDTPPGISRFDMTSLRAKVAELTGSEVPEPVKLRRVTARSLIMSVLVLLITSALISALTTVDFDAIWAVLETADWPVMALALIVGHTQFFPQATASMFAVPARLPFWPLLTLQTASQFISLAIPSVAGRVAMNAAFLRKFGVSATEAVAQGAIDGFSGFLVQVAIMIIVLIGGDVVLNLDVDTTDVQWLLVLAVVAALGVGVVIAVLRIDALRTRVVPVVSQAWGALIVVFRQPVRAIGLLGSNFVYWNVLGITLWLILQSVGSDVSYGSALFAAAGTSLLAGFVPVPGGVGVAEATMTALLVTFGVDESTAFAVTAVYRIITFYLPALEGFFGTRWLERNEYI